MSPGAMGSPAFFQPLEVAVKPQLRFPSTAGLLPHADGWFQPDLS